MIALMLALQGLSARERWATFGAWYRLCVPAPEGIESTIILQWHQAPFLLWDAEWWMTSPLRRLRPPSVEEYRA